MLFYTGQGRCRLSLNLSHTQIVTCNFDVNVMYHKYIESLLDNGFPLEEAGPMSTVLFSVFEHVVLI